jgi:hypothetical protein
MGEKENENETAVMWKTIREGDCEGGSRGWIQGDLGGSEGRTEAELEGGSSEEIEVGVAGGKERREGRGAKKGEGGGWREREGDTAREREREPERDGKREHGRASERATKRERERYIKRERRARVWKNERERMTAKGLFMYVCRRKGDLKGWLSLHRQTERKHVRKREDRRSTEDQKVEGGGLEEPYCRPLLHRAYRDFRPIERIERWREGGSKSLIAGSYCTAHGEIFIASLTDRPRKNKEGRGRIEDR